MAAPLLADPFFLPPFSPEGAVQVVVETPRGARNKYAFDRERHVLVLRKILPAGMVFPYDFGFVPSTLAPDGDPIDVLLLLDEPAVPGCVVEARLIGVIQGENVVPGGAPYRNDRLLAVACLSQVFAGVNDLANLPAEHVAHMEQFFVAYPELLGGKPYRLLGAADKAKARDLLDEAVAAARQG